MSNSALRLMWTYRIGPRKAVRVKRLLDVIDDYSVEIRKQAGGVQRVGPFTFSSRGPRLLAAALGAYLGTTLENVLMNHFPSSF